MDESLPKDMPAFTKNELIKERELEEKLPSVKYTNVLSEEFLASLEDIEIEPWYAEANCKNQQQTMYDHFGETKLDKSRREERAKDLCQKCKIVQICLERSIENDERGAVWGGLNDEERTKLKKSRKAS